MMPRFRRQLASLLSSSYSTDLSRNYSLFQFFADGQRSEARACIELQNVRGFDEREVMDRTRRLQTTITPALTVLRFGRFLKRGQVALKSGPSVRSIATSWPWFQSKDRIHRARSSASCTRSRIPLRSVSAQRACHRGL